MRDRRDEGGFTLVETMVALSLFAFLSVSFYWLMFSAVKGSDTTESVVRMSEEARLGFNRMVRDTREANELSACTPTDFSNCYRVKVDYDGNGVYANPNTTGGYEDLTYRYSSLDKEITLNGQTLITGVRTVPGKPVFSYMSNALEYDANANGMTTAAELDASGVAGVGNGNGVLDNPELNYVTSVSFAFRVEHGNRNCSAGITSTDPCGTFYAESQLRNRR